MRQVARKGLITVAVASGMLAITGGYAHADAGAGGSAEKSPDFLSNNTIEAPVHAPVNLCGNNVSVVGVLSPAFGNKCVNDSSKGGSGSGTHGESRNSTGVGSGNVIEAPIDIPVNACGNNINVVGIASPAYDNKCVNDSGPPRGHENPDEPGYPEKPDYPDHRAPERPNAPETHTVTPQESVELAHTGASDTLGVALPASAALILGGAVLYRRARAASRS